MARDPEDVVRWWRDPLILSKNDLQDLTYLERLIQDQRILMAPHIQPVMHVGPTGQISSLVEEGTTSPMMRVALVDSATGGEDWGKDLRQYSYLISKFTVPPTVSRHYSATEAVNPAPKLVRGIGRKAITLAGGSVADQELVPALADYYGVVQLKALIADSADTYELVFQDEDDVVCAGLGAAGRVDVVVGTAYVPVSLEPFVITQATETENKALEVDVGGGAGAEELCLLYEYWYET